MARAYDAGSQLPPLDDFWNCAPSSSRTRAEVDPTDSACCYDKLSSGPTTNATSQYRGPTFQPSHTPASYTAARVGGYQQTNVRVGVPYGIMHSDAHHLTNGPSYGYNPPSSRPIIPEFCYGYERLSRDYHHPFHETDMNAMVPRDLPNGLDVTNHVDGSSFTRNTLDGLLSQIGSDWSADAVGDDIFLDLYGIESVPIPVDHVNTSTPNAPSNPSLQPSPSPSDASSTQARFACHHPQCGGRTFGRRADRDRHARVHDGTRAYACPKANCKRRFYRRDKLQSHLERGH